MAQEKSSLCYSDDMNGRILAGENPARKLYPKEELGVSKEIRVSGFPDESHRPPASAPFQGSDLYSTLFEISVVWILNGLWQDKGAFARDLRRNGD